MHAFRRALRALFIVLSAVPALLLASSSPLQAATGGAGTASIEGLDRALAEVARLEAQPSADGSTQRALLELWRSTAESLRAAARSRERAAELERLRVEAPARLEVLRAELIAPATGLPPAEEGRDLAALEQDLAQAQAQRASAESLVQELQLERRKRSDRRFALPGEINRAQQQVDAASQAGSALPDSDDSAAMAEARQARTAARKLALQAELQALQAELSSYEARGESLTVRQDLAARRAYEATALTQELNRRVNEKRSLQAQTASEEAESARRRLASEPAPIRELAAGNEELASERRELVQLAVETEALAEQLRAEGEEIEQRGRSVARRVAAAQFTKPVALLMRRHRTELPDVGRHRARLRSLQRTTSEQLARQLDIEDQRASLANLEAAVQSTLEALEALEAHETEDELDESEDELDERESTIRLLLTQRRQILEDLHQQQGSYLTQLAELDAAERRLIQVTEAYGAFIDEHLLWLRGSSVLGPRDLAASGRAVRWLLAPAAWTALLGELARGVGERPLDLVPGLVALVLILLRRQLLGRVQAIGTELGRSRRHRFRQTAEALAIVLVAASAWPLACWWGAGLIASAGSETSLGPALSAGLALLARMLVPIFLLHDLFQPLGVAHAHFRWPAPVLDAVRDNQWLLAGVAAPAFLIDAVLDAQERPEARDSLGRLALVVAYLSLALYLRRTLDPASRPPGRRLRFAHLVHRLAFGVPILLALAAVFGYVFATRELGSRLLQTLVLLLSIAVAHATAVRWIVVERRRLRLEELRRQGQAEPVMVDVGEGATESMIAAGEEGIDLDVVDSQARQLLRAAAVVTVAACAWWLWADLMPAARWTERVVLWERSTPVEASTPTVMEAAAGAASFLAEEPVAAGVVSLFDLLAAFGVVGLTIFAASNVPGLLEIAVLRRAELEPGTGYAVTTLTRYAITIVGVVGAASLLGISWTSVQWLAAAMTVGLGFGLQEIFANFVSGLIILFERPVRVGDVVTVGGVEGQVTRIRTRATTITDWDRRELLVPNREFITGQLINWSLTDPVTRIVIPVGIAYGSDTRLATETLLAIARSHPIVLQEPRSSVVFRSFGESSLDFQLRVFIPRRDVWPQVVHELHLAIDDAFREAGIEIAFPQRDIHVRTLPKEPVDVGEDPE